MTLLLFSSGNIKEEASWPWRSLKWAIHDMKDVQIWSWGFGAILKLASSTLSRGLQGSTFLLQPLWGEQPTDLDQSTFWDILFSSLTHKIDRGAENFTHRPTFQLWSLTLKESAKISKYCRICLSQILKQHLKILLDLVHTVASHSMRPALAQNLLEC